MTLLGMALISWRISSWGISCHVWRNNAKSSGLEDGFLFFLRSFRSNMPQRFSIGFISRDWLGHGSLLIPFWLNQCCVALAEWQGAPSSINRELTLFILPLENIGRKPSCNIETYLAELMFASHSARSERPSLQIAPHTITEKPPCFTVGCCLFKSNSCWGSLHTHTLPLSGNNAKRDSSEKMTLVQKVIGLSTISWAQSFLRLILAKRRSFFLAALQ